MNEDYYNKKVVKHLSDATIYNTLIAPLSFQDIKNKLYDILKRHGQTGLFKRLIPEEYSVPEFYVLPKLHKTPPSVRPFVPSHSSITTCTSKYLDKELQKLLEYYPWVLRNTTDAILALEKRQILGNDCKLVTADVESMYTNIHIA